MCVPSNESERVAAVAVGEHEARQAVLEEERRELKAQVMFMCYLIILSLFVLCLLSSVFFFPTCGRWTHCKRRCESLSRRRLISRTMVIFSTFTWLVYALLFL